MSRIAEPRPIDPDLPLVQAARNGNFDAFEKLVARYERQIYTLALRIVGRSQDAEEVVQETFLSVVQHIRDFQERSSFHTWLVRIATNHALKLLRKRKGQAAVSLDQPANDSDDAPLPHPEFIAEWADEPSRLALRREVQETVDRALAHLDEKYRVVFVLRDIQELSTEETARLLGISVANVKVRLLRARLMLREQLTRLYGDPQRRIVHRHDHDQ